MNPNIPFVYAYFRRKGYTKRQALVEALRCCYSPMEMQ